MPSPSNLYAEKVFSEHPLLLWALDDATDYLSLISENDRIISSWDITGGTVVSSPSSVILDYPFPDSQATIIRGDEVLSGSGTIKFVSENIKNFNDLDYDLGNITFSSYLYANTAYVDSYEIGYVYADTTTGTNVEVLKKFPMNIKKQWALISETFDYPKENTTFKAVLKINYIGGGTQAQNEFAQTGFSVGQWSENFNAKSLGITPINLPSNIAISSGYQGTPAVSYGLSEKPGYYLIKNNKLLASNRGLPLVFGSSNVTKISQNSGDPSLILPGDGILNDSGRFREYTLEAWIRLHSDSMTAKKIIGPIASSDGIYADGPFIVLKIGDNNGSYFVGKWDRPMLLHLRIRQNIASLLVNGEEVISLAFTSSDLELPLEYNKDTGKHQDWIGFYAYEDIEPVEIDCVGIYPYTISEVMAKRRFVYGQGVEFPENINTAYSGTSTYVDYAFSDYSNNYSYPNLGKWDQGIVDNLDTSNNLLSVPTYADPVFVFSNKTTENLYTDCAVVQNEDSLFLTFRPSTSWNTTQGYMLIENLQLLNEPTDTFYAIFKPTELTQNRMTLVRLDNTTTSDYLSIDLVGDRVEYILKQGGAEETLYTSYGVIEDVKFGVGLNIRLFTEYFGQRAYAFFGNTAGIKVYVGGSSALTNTFTGNIYQFSLCSARNLANYSDIFDSKGLPIQYENVFDDYSQEVLYDAEGTYFGNSSAFWNYVLDGGTPYNFITETMTDHNASLSIMPQNYFDTFSVDFSLSGYWEDHIPLTQFATYKEDEQGGMVYDLDFIQFNIDYSLPKMISEIVSDSQGWTYAELQSEFSNPVEKKYSDLDNYLFTGYESYGDLQNKLIKTFRYDTSSAYVRSFITFQYLSSGANAPRSAFNRDYPVRYSNVVEPQSNWMTSRYEVVDGTVIYPPSGVDINDLAIVTHLEYSVDGIKNRPIRLRSLEYASLSMSDTTPTKISTRFGNPIYPYSSNGYYLDYKGKNPFLIYKNSMPYLYMTRDSGIRVVGNVNNIGSRGLMVPINQSKEADFKVIAIQMALRCDLESFPISAMEVCEIESAEGAIKIFVKANDRYGQRAKVYAVNTKTGKQENSIAIYIDGNIAKDPVLSIEEWSMLGISFQNMINFDEFTGSVKLTGPFIFNNISHYRSTNLQTVQRIEKRPWYRVKVDSVTNLELDWDYWHSSFIWNGVLIIASTSYYSVDPSDIYKSYVGTNKIIVDDTRELTLGSYEYSVYSDIAWQSHVQSPA